MRKFLCVLIASALFLCSACDSGSSSKKSNKKVKDKDDEIEEVEDTKETEETTEVEHTTKPHQTEVPRDTESSEETSSETSSETSEESTEVTTTEVTETTSEETTVTNSSVITSDMYDFKNYDDVLSLAYDYVYTDLIDELDNIPDEFWGLFECHYYSEADIRYAKADIDENGVEELIIYDGDSNAVILCYTMDSATKTPVFLFNGTARQTFYILEFGKIHFNGTGGAAYAIYGSYEIGEDGKSLSEKGFYYTDFANVDDEGNIDYDSLSWYYTDKFENVFNIEKSEYFGSTNDFGYEMFEPGLGPYEFESSNSLSDYK